jgi:hypothetical protein
VAYVEENVLPEVLNVLEVGEPKAWSDDVVELTVAGAVALRSF